MATLTCKDSPTLVDFVAHGDSPDEWVMVLVEEGPWLDSIGDQLRRVQERLYGCVDAALDGQLASVFPESKGKHVVVRLDGYDLPRAEVQAFFDRFASGVFLIEDYREALENNPFVKGISFKLDGGA